MVLIHAAFHMQNGLRQVEKKDLGWGLLPSPTLLLAPPLLWKSGLASIKVRPTDRKAQALAEGA